MSFTMRSTMMWVLLFFKEEGESAKTTERTELQRLLQYCRTHKGKVHFVIVYNVTRFARDKYDHFALRAHLQSLGISLRSVTEPIDDTSTGKLMEGVLAAFAQFDNDQKAERTKAGMMTAIGRGHWTWKAPLGYVNGNKRAGEPSLVPDPARAPLITKAYEMAASGEHSVSDVRRMVTALGLKTGKGRPISLQSFHSLLGNPIYAGVLNAPSFGLTGLHGDFQPLVSAVLFGRVQIALARRGPASRRLDNPDFPLRRFVVCDACSTPLTGSASKGRTKRYSYYHCRKCKGVAVPKEALEHLFVDQLQTLKPRAEFMVLFRTAVLDVWKQRSAAARNLRSDLERRLQELERRETLLVEAFVYQKQIDPKTYERQRDKVREEITLARIELEDRRLDELDVEGIVGFAEQVLANAARLWMAGTPDQRQRLQRVLFPEGLRLKGDRFGTTVTCLAFNQLQENPSMESGLASPTGFEPVFWP
jgi:site-specific DNA recombinase